MYPSIYSTIYPSMYINLYILISVHLLYLLIYALIYWSINYLSTYLSICQFIYLSVHLFIIISVYILIRLFICLSINIFNPRKIPHIPCCTLGIMSICKRASNRLAGFHCVCVCVSVSVHLKVIWYDQPADQLTASSFALPLSPSASARVPPLCIFYAAPLWASLIGQAADQKRF